MNLYYNGFDYVNGVIEMTPLYANLAFYGCLAVMLVMGIQIGKRLGWKAAEAKKRPDPECGTSEFEAWAKDRCLVVNKSKNFCCTRLKHEDDAHSFEFQG